MTKIQAVEQVLLGLSLSKEERWELAQWLQKNRIKSEWKELFKSIDNRVKKHGPPPSEDKIAEACQEVRKERYKPFQHL